MRPLIEKASRTIERDRELPRELLDAMHEAGLFRLLLPRSIGGEEIDLPTFVAAVEQVTMGDGSTAWCLAQGAGCSMTAAYVAPALLGLPVTSKLI
jgi:alkylation response protein AidB-like acyl-CoA dehydrogenase